MKTKLLSLLIIMLSCFTTKAQCTRSALFQSAGVYQITGTVSLVYTSGGDKMLDIASGFSTEAGPDLHVYLANTAAISTPSGVNPPGVVDLGSLSTNSGGSTYIIPSQVEIDDYAYVIIQCKGFNANWGNATLGTIQGTCNALGTKENSLDTFTFYPNPATSKINISGNKIEQLKVNIYNTIGDLVMKSNIMTAKNNELSLTNLSTGIYLIEFIYNNKRNVRKLVIK